MPPSPKVVPPSAASLAAAADSGIRRSGRSEDGHKPSSPTVGRGQSDTSLDYIPGDTGPSITWPEPDVPNPEPRFSSRREDVDDLREGSSSGRTSGNEAIDRRHRYPDSPVANGRFGQAGANGYDNDHRLDGPLPERPFVSDFDASPDAMMDGARVSSMTGRAGQPQSRSALSVVGLFFGWLVLIATVAAGATGLMWQPARVMSVAPGMAKFYAALGYNTGGPEIRITDLTAEWRGRGPRSLLAVEGLIYNDGATDWDRPELVFSLKDEAGGEILAWTTPVRRTGLAAGKSSNFALRVPIPNPRVRQLEIRMPDGAVVHTGG